MQIRLETEKDYRVVENLTREAFWDVYRPGCNEHLVLHRLRQAESFIHELDYIVVQDNKIVGNIVYTKMFHEQKMCNEIIAFGPISVHPDYQRKGIGKYMIEYTIQKAKELGFKAIMITGDTKYYHKLGFVSASSYNVHLPGMSIEDEAPFFMAIELEKNYLKDHPGIYEFDPCFNVTDEALEIFEKEFPPKAKRAPREGDLS